MTPAQRRTLEAVRDGQVTRVTAYGGGWEGPVRRDVVSRLSDEGLVAVGAPLLTSGHRSWVVLTDAGRELFARRAREREAA